MPTIYDYLGTQDNPFSLNTDKYTFIQLLQKVFDYVFPEEQYTLVKSDIIYQWVSYTSMLLPSP